jgi:hypothetical protein
MMMAEADTSTIPAMPNSSSKLSLPCFYQSSSSKGYIIPLILARDAQTSKYT